MATITWQDVGCRIIRFEAGDLYTDEKGRVHDFPTRCYLLLVGPINLYFDYFNGVQDSVRFTVPDNVRPEDSPIALLAYKPDPYEWWDFISRNADAEAADVPRIVIDKAVDQYESDDEEESM